MNIQILEDLKEELPETLHFVEVMFGKLSIDEIIELFDYSNVNYELDKNVLVVEKQLIRNLSDSICLKILNGVLSQFCISEFVNHELIDDQLTINVKRRTV